MQLREYALSVVEAITLEEKLRPPPADWIDSEPGEPLRMEAPTRPSQLIIADARSVKVPPLAGMQDVSQRRRILHALANHELQAAELFAWTLLAFPEQPKSFRRGLLQILVEEQEHCQLYIDCLRALGGEFGDHPVTGHFWHQIGTVQTPMDFVCVMGLTFENANIDFARDYAEAAREVGDQAMASAIDRVHEEEIRHVAFAWRWLERLKDDSLTAVDAYCETVRYPLGLSRARGARMDCDARRQAGLDEDFIQALKDSRATRPNGRDRT